MDTILRKPLLHDFNTSDHLEFHQLSYVICNKYITKTGDKAKMGEAVKAVNPDDLIVAYHDALSQEEHVYKWLRKSDYTAKKAKTDLVRDGIVRNITGIVHRSMKHYDPAVRESALHVNNLLEVYGNITKADYDAETAIVDNLAMRLQSADYQAAVATLGLGVLVEQLESTNTLFKSYVDGTAKEQLAKPAITPKAARSQTDNALFKITGFVTSIIVLIGEEDFLAGFVAEFNVLVNHYNTLVHEHYGRIHARIDIAPGVIDPIAVQLFTGKPVFVIPNVTLVVKEKDGTEKTVVLEFTKDFTVAYENNVNVGMATLHVTGIGKYVGTLTTTFNIERQFLND
jgi:hypothetical protein